MVEAWQKENRREAKMNRDIVCEWAEEVYGLAALKYSGYICPEYRGELMIIVPLAEAKTIYPNSSMMPLLAKSSRLPSMAGRWRASFP